MEVHGYLIIGQSLAEGGVGLDNVKENCDINFYPDKVFMLTPRPVGEFGQDLDYPIVSLKEDKRVTIANSFARYLIKHEKKDIKIIISGDAFGGKSYQELKKGGDSKSFERIKDQLLKIHSKFKTIKYKAILCIHGESDGCKYNQNYDKDLIEWRKDIINLIYSITNQKENIRFLISQTSTASGYGYDKRFRTPIQQLKAHDLNSNIFLVCPKYFLDYKDKSHITNSSQVVLGEYFAKAYVSIKTKGYYSPLRPKNFSIFNNSLTITYEGNSGPIVIDTKTVREIDNYGFNYDDDNNKIEKIVILSDNQLKIYFHKTLENKGRLSYGYCNGEIHKQEYGFGDRGNIRDSDQSELSISGCYLFNWSIIFEKEISI